MIKWTMKTHKLKIEREYFLEVVNGNKTAEIRYDDRGFEVGDLLDLHEIDRDGAETGRRAIALITYILKDFGLKEGYAMLCIQYLGRGV